MKFIVSTFGCFIQNWRLLLYKIVSNCALFGVEVFLTRSEQVSEFLWVQRG